MRNLLIYSLVTTGIITFYGCENQQKKEAAQAPQTAQIKTVRPEYQFSAVAQYIRNDGSKYITQQHFQIASSPRAIMISAAEPFGNVVWSVENGIYSAPQNTGRAIDKDVFALMTDKDIAIGIMELYLAAAGKVQAADTNEILNFDGKIYEQVATEGEAKVYRNKSTKTIDLVTSGGQKNGGTYLFSGYNYEKILENGIEKGLYPSKVDIYLYKSAYDKRLLGQLTVKSE
ncbi:MAG: hypothetical protein ABFD79_12245 [Phycisphaerales bacterium]